MNTSNKYYNLFKFLVSSDKDEVILTFDEIEDILGFKLEPYFLKYVAAWSGRADKSPTHSQKRAWEDAGYTVKKCYLKDKKVVFIKLNELGTTKPQKKKIKNNDDISKLNIYKRITSDEIEKVHNDVIKSNNYGKEGLIIHDVFNQFKENNDLNVIAMKIAVIDITNSTNLARHKSKISLYDLATIILNIKDFDDRVAIGDPKLVNEISKRSKEQFDVNVFSFASKYCCYHNVEIYGRDDYSIYDSIVSDSLSSYISGVKTSEIKACKDQFNYKKYNDLIGSLLDANNISIPFRRRKLDHYIWYTGKGF